MHFAQIISKHVFLDEHYHIHCDVRWLKTQWSTLKVSEVQRWTMVRIEFFLYGWLM